MPDTQIPGGGVSDAGQMRRALAQKVAHTIVGVLFDADERGVTFPHAELLRQAFNALQLYIEPPASITASHAIRGKGGGWWPSIP